MLDSKKDYQDCLKKIIDPVKNIYTEGFAGLKCGFTGVSYGNEIALMEGFARILWGLAPFWAGDGEDKEFEEIYLQGIINGTDPDHEEYWGDLRDWDQKLVEAAAMGLGLILAPDKLWKPLTETQKNNFYNWLNQANYVKPADNNWHMFSVMVNLGFKTIGMPYNKEVMEQSMSRIDEFYIGDGWYTDGISEQIDYYIAFAIHFYSLIYAKVMENEDKERCLVIKERANLFASDFIYYFDDDGSSIAFGRSMTYRFAQCCFWSACIYAGIEPFPMGVMKGIISRNLEWWMNKPIFDNGNILSIGYAYPNLCMSEGYNAFGSPYWALKSFLILSLDENHAFFKAKNLPLPELEKLHIIKKANIVIQRINGGVYALTGGQWADWNPMHVAEKYSKFVYSSKYAYSIPRSYYGVENAGSDNMLVFVKDNMCFVRRKCIEHRVNDDGSLYSKWSPIEGVLVETLIIPTEKGCIRKHTVISDSEYTAYDCSFATCNADDEVSGNGELYVIGCAPNTNLMNPYTVMNAVKYTLTKGTHSLETKVVYPEQSKK